MNQFVKSHADVNLYSFVKCSEVAALGLLELNGLEKRLEVSRTEALVVPPLDNLDEESGPVLERFGEDLKQIALLVVIDQQVQLFDMIQVLLNRGALLLQTLA